MPDSPSWFSSYCTKLLFFARIRRFLRRKAAASKCSYQSSDHFDRPKPIEAEPKMLTMEETEEEESFGLQRSVKQLHFGSWEEKETAAREIARLASKDLKTRKSLAALGVVPSLVSMLDSDAASSNRQRLAIRALIELANGTYTNKALMAEAGIISKLPANINALEESLKQDYVLLLLSISCLAKTQFSDPLPEMIPFLIGVLSSQVSMEVKTACVGAIYNLSTVLENAGPLVSNGTVHSLLRLSLGKEASEKALATLGNLVVSVMGKKAMEEESMVPESLIEIMTWETEPKCQELAAYILMILAHQSSAQREKMAQLGIVQVLLEVALLGSALAQKRALKLLQWFKDERQTRIGAHSGPQTGRITAGSPINQREISEGREIIKKMVKQSLDKNMELITRRANVGGDGDSKLKSLFVSSSSKSLPY